MKRPSEFLAGVFFVCEAEFQRAISLYLVAKVSAGTKNPQPPTATRQCECSSVRRQLRGGGGLFLEKGFDAGDVFGDVDADGVVFHFGHANFPAVFEPAELFKLFDFFEGALGEGGVFEQGVALEDVETEVLEVAGLDFSGGVADPRDGGAGEIEGIVVEVEDGLADVGVHDIAGHFDGGGDGGYLGGRLLKDGVYRGVNHFGIEEGFVALDVNENLAAGVGGDFGDAFGAGTVLSAGHARFAAKGLDRLYDAVIVGGDDDVGGHFGELGAFVNAPDHTGTRDGNEGLAGQAGGAVACGNNDDNVGRTHLMRAPSRST